MRGVPSFQLTKTARAKHIFSAGAVTRLISRGHEENSLRKTSVEHLLDHDPSSRASRATPLFRASIRAAADTIAHTLHVPLRNASAYVPLLLARWACPRHKHAPAASTPVVHPMVTWGRHCTVGTPFPVSTSCDSLTGVPRLLTSRRWQLSCGPSESLCTICNGTDSDRNGSWYRPSRSPSRSVRRVSRKRPGM